MNLESNIEELESHIAYWIDRISLYEDTRYSEPEQVLLELETLNTILKDMKCQLDQGTSSIISDLM